MDRSSAPWRVLDEPASASAQPAGEPSGPAGVPLHLVGGIVLAAVLAVAAFLIAAAVPAGGISVDGGTAWTSSAPPSAGGAPPQPSGLVVIDIQGAVLRPGVLRLQAGSRVGDAIEAAGGFGPRVDAARAALELNLAAVLADGERVLVPSRDDPPPTSGGGEGAAGGSGESGSGAGLVNVNSASESELDELPGIGPKTAQKIIAAREEQPFTSVDDLLSRKVVGQSVFEKIRALVAVR